MEQVVEVLAIEDYSVSQTTLDNVSHSQVIKDTAQSPSTVPLLVGFCELR